jgi:nitrite reductase/ring-hydroxylating ferredoxin subunit/uncharacterized membrane protein
MRLADTLHRWVEQIGQSEALEQPAGQAAELMRPLVGTDAVKTALSGAWLGHRLHPMLTDVVIGCWVSAGLLDLTGGRASREAADRLLATGVVAVLPTAAAGWSDYTDLYDHGRRVALIHAVTVNVATVLQAVSVAARRSGRRGTGVAASLAALGAMSAGAWLGGHLSYVLGVGVDHTGFDEGPEDWETVGTSSEFGPTPTVVRAGEHEVMVVRLDGELVAMANRCTHAGWPLAGGEVADGCITCPQHGSRFRLRDGSVVRGPAATAQLRYHVREVEGEVQVRGTR